MALAHSRCVQPAYNLRTTLTTRLYAPFLHAALGLAGSRTTAYNLFILFQDFGVLSVSGLIENGSQ